ncbi:hypothetical protein QAD02_005836 [Eretmocerus hayati]|uniref:Uncharacterized protein n=1 Tax=Eretmocerus hayati TaxID=131215 RepID=A0ACC2NTJ8_9HYME|nr:hypothetical protein QAD02_005836 [Eretmocerus hayati]
MGARKGEQTTAIEVCEARAVREAKLALVECVCSLFPQGYPKEIAVRKIDRVASVGGKAPKSRDVLYDDASGSKGLPKPSSSFFSHSEKRNDSSSRGSSIYCYMETNILISSLCHPIANARSTIFNFFTHEFAPTLASSGMFLPRNQMPEIRTAVVLHQAKALILDLEFGSSKVRVTSALYSLSTGE